MEMLSNQNLIVLPECLLVAPDQLSTDLVLSNPYEVPLVFKIKSNDIETIVLSQFEGVIDPLSQLRIQVQLTEPKKCEVSEPKIQVKWCVDEKNLGFCRLRSFSDAMVQQKVIPIRKQEKCDCKSMKSEEFMSMIRTIDELNTSTTGSRRDSVASGKIKKTPNIKKRTAAKRGQHLLLHVATVGILLALYFIFSRVTVR